MGRTKTIASRVARTVETPVSTFLQALGLEDDLEPPKRFLLLAGVPAHPSGRGPVRLRMASFATETQARAAFRQLRLRTEMRVYWAEVVSLDPDDNVKRLCWFGDAWDVDTGGRSWWADTDRPEGSARRARLLRHRTARSEAGGPAAGAGGSAGPPIVRLLPSS